MNRLHLDIETFSKVDIGECGAYKYALDPSFDILLIAYAYDNGPVGIIDLASGEVLPESIISDLLDPHVRKVAHNASFERICFTVFLRAAGRLEKDEWLDASQWDCTMVLAARCGLPLSLKQVGEALHFEEQKMPEGRKCIEVFCKPHEGKGTLIQFPDRVMPSAFPELWETFKSYCIRDVEVERNIDKALAWYKVSDAERELYALDQRINDRGVLVDLTMAEAAHTMDAKIKAMLVREAITLTGLSNPNSLSQLKVWLGEQMDREFKSLTKADVADLMKDKSLPAKARRVLEIRAEMGKTSCAKYEAMLNVACADGRARGLTQFYGTRTGRWAGRLIQLQNLPQNHLPDEDLDLGRQLLRDGDYDMMSIHFGNVPDTMSQLIRTAFIAPEGKTFAVCDFSAIEARVLAWCAGEDWVLDAFRAGKDIYCETASQMFHVPVEKNGVNGELRQKGKIAVLALGYGGGKGALDRMGGQRMGMTETEEAETVRMWRAANPKIVKFWHDVEEAAFAASTYGHRATVGQFVFAKDGDDLTITLPSGRMLVYPEVEETTNRFGNKSLSFMTLNQETKAWERTETYGGKLTENLIQAVARDCLAHVMVSVEVFYPVVFHVHDELICEVKAEHGADHLYMIQHLFAKGPAWAKGLPLKGAGYTTPYYKKD